MAQKFDPSTIDLRLRAVWGVSNRQINAHLDLEWGEDGHRNRAAEKRVLDALGEGWQETYTYHRPVQPLPWGAPPSSARAEMLAEMRGRLEDASVTGADAVQAFPTGWLHIAEVMTHRMCAWAAEGEEIRIQQIKEKFGTLRCYIYGSARLHDLSEWCEAQSEDRCMATGKKGAARRTGWILTLSDEMYELYQKDRDAVVALIYPPSAWA